MKQINLLRNKLLYWHLTNGVSFSLSSLKNPLIKKENPSENQHRKKDTLYSESTKGKDKNIIANTLEELKNELDHFEGCTLKRTAKNLVFSDGNPKAQVMLLGEAPGEEEDKIGKPFVGTAGKLLDKMLASIGQNRKNTYLSNVVFWRPPGNRNPSDQEIKVCFPFVMRHIEIIKPKILILAGAISAKTVLDNDTLGITRLRGIWHELEIGAEKTKIKTMPIFHPAFLLRQPARKREAWEDLKKIRDEIKKIT